MLHCGAGSGGRPGPPQAGQHLGEPVGSLLGPDARLPGSSDQAQGWGSPEGPPPHLGGGQEEAPRFKRALPPPAPRQGLQPLSCSLSARCPARRPGSRGCCRPRGPARLCPAPRSMAPPGRPASHPGRRAEAQGPGSRRASCPLRWGPSAGRPRTWCAGRRGCGCSGPPSPCSGS